jgi:enterobactin synthetase component D
MHPSLPLTPRLSDTADAASTHPNAGNNSLPLAPGFGAPNMGAGGAPFIDRVARSLIVADEALPYVLGRFHADRFEHALFDRLAIDLPEQIRHSVHKRQAEFLAGRLCARTVLASHGRPGYGVAVGPQREPLWPKGMIGSITHSSHYAAAVACPDQQFAGIGIDIESVPKADGSTLMGGTVVSPRELACLRATQTGLELDCLLTLVFSAKESFFKAAFRHVGRYFDFDAVEVFDISVGAGLIHFRCTETLCPLLPKGQAHSARFDFIDPSTVLTMVALRDGPRDGLAGSVH